MQKTTSDVIINYLLNNPPSTVDELSRKLILTKADIRYQLKRLIKNGVVKSILAEKNNSRGRPAARFTVVAEIYPDNLIEIVEAFIFLNQNNIQQIYTKLANYLASQFEIQHDRHLVIQLNDLILELNLRNYKSKWETHIDGPLIFFHNCPYRNLLTHHPGFCTLDKVLLSTLLKKDVQHKQSFLEKNSIVCKFQIMNL